MRDSIRRFSRTEPDLEVLDALIENVRYISGTFDDSEAYDQLAAVRAGVRRARRDRLQPHLLPLDRAAVLPRDRRAAGPAEDGPHQGAPRCGSSSRSRSAPTWPRRRSSTAASCASSDETQVFRIDHYLGKETVQNLLAFRFANAIFEPIWNRNYVDYVQITAAEDIGIGGRAGYYDSAGALRDMVQNHMLQLLALLCMEPPASFGANRAARREGQGAAGDRAADARGGQRDGGARAVRPGDGRAASGARVPGGGRRAGRTRAPRPTPRCGCTWRTGAGPACRSTCARASAWRARSPRSRSR